MSFGSSPQRSVSKTRCDVQIRWMIRRDMSEVLDIERQCFEFAWSEEDFLCCLRQRNCIGMVAERQERIVGFMIYELLKSQLHVLNFAVAPWSRRQGVASQMVEKLVNKLSQQCVRKSVWKCVRPISRHNCSSVARACKRMVFFAVTTKILKKTPT